MAQLVAMVSDVVLGGVAEVVGSNLARGKIFTASICSVDSLYPSVYIYLTVMLHVLCLFSALSRTWQSVSRRGCFNKNVSKKTKAQTVLLI